jgi:hypothetical protein
MSLEAIECPLLILFLDAIIAILNAFIFFLNQTGRRLTNKLYEVEEPPPLVYMLVAMVLPCIFLGVIESLFFPERRRRRILLLPLQEEEIKK